MFYAKAGEGAAGGELRRSRYLSSAAFGFEVIGERGVVGL